MLRISDRYILREVFSPFVFGVAAFTGLFVASEVVFSISMLIARGNVAFSDVVLLFVYRLPPIMVMTFPMAMLLGALLGMARISNSGELIALRTSGASLCRLVLPVIVMSFLVSLGSLMISESLVPAASKAAFELENRMLNRQQAWLRGDNLVFASRENGILQISHVGRLRDTTLMEVVVTEIMPSGVIRTTQAPRGIWDESYWYYQNGTVIETYPDGSSTRMSFEGAFKTLPIQDSPEQISVSSDHRRPDSLTYAEFRQRIETLRQRGASPAVIRRNLLDLHSKVAIPFASVVFALIGIPLGIQPHRSGGSIGFGLSILIILVYYVIMTIARALGESGALPPALGAWLQNLLVGGVGAYLVIRADQ